MSFRTGFAVADFLDVLFARPVSFIFVIFVSRLAEIVTIVMIAVRVAMVHFACSWLFSLRLYF